MFIFLKFLTYVIFTFIVLNFYLNKIFKVEKIIELSLIIGLGLSIIDYLVKNKFKEKFNFNDLFGGQPPNEIGMPGQPPNGTGMPGPSNGMPGPPPPQPPNQMYNRQQPQGYDSGSTNSMSSF